MKIKEKLKENKKKVIIISVILVILLVILAVVLFLLFQKQGNGDNRMGNRGGNRSDFAVSEDMIAASGVTSVGITEESFDVENLTTGLEVEEIYISSETEISEGAKVLKLSEESVAEAKEELEQVLREADLAYRAGAIEYQQNLITAEYDRDSKILTGEFAKEVYDETVAGLQDSVDKAQEAITEAKEQIAEYESYVNNDSYSTYFEVDKYQAIYDENLDAIEDKLEDWNLTWSQITGQGGGMGSSNSGNTQQSSSGNSSNTGQQGDVSGGNTQNPSSENTKTNEEEVATSADIQMLSSLYKILEENMKDWEQAETDCENAKINAPFNLQTLQLQLPKLEQGLAEAKENYETQILQAKLTYETSLANAESAESDYETAIQKAESDYETLKDDWEDAKENLELFENTVGDGYFYASGNGTILRTMLRAGQNLTSEAVIFMYSNPEEMTVTVSVDQADISKVTLGDSAYIQSTEYGSFEGTVTEINPVSASSSRTSVTYDVTITFSGDTTTLPANESVTVILGMDEATMSQMLEGSQMPTGGQMPTDGQMPEGGQMPADGQMPEGGQMPTDGQRPEGGQMPTDGQRPERGNGSQDGSDGKQ